MDNLFWLGRYAERTESLVRILRAAVLRLAGDTGLNATTNGIEVARRLLVPQEYVTPEAIELAALGDESGLKEEVQAAVFAEESKGLQRVLTCVARTAWSARDRLSLDTWRAVYALTTWDPRDEPAEAFDGTAARAYLDMLVGRAAALAGLSAENMTRGNNWLFFDLGRRIERILSVCSLVRHTFAPVEERESAALQVALEVADSAMTYSYRYRNVFQAAPALDLLVLDPTNPRAVAFQVEAVAHHAADLPMSTEVQQRGRPRALANALRETVASADAYVLARPNAEGRRVALIALLDEVEVLTRRLSDAIEDEYLQHLPRLRA